MARQALVENLFSHTLAIEMQTQGKMPATAWLSLIRTGIAPACPSQAKKADLVVPVIMCVDSSQQPVRFPDRTRSTHVGLAVCFAEEAVLGWMRGTIRIRMHNFNVDYDSILSGKRMAYREAIGLHLRDSSGVWSLLFTHLLPKTVTEQWREDLLATLTRRERDAD